MDKFGKNLTIKEPSRPKMETSQLQSRSERAVKRSRCDDIRNIPGSNDDEEFLQPPILKKVKIEASPMVPFAISQTHLAKHQVPAVKSANGCVTEIYPSISLHTTRSSPPARKRSNSLPCETYYNAHAHVSVTRQIRPFHHDFPTTHGSQVHKKTVIEMVRMELKAHNLDISNMVLERCSRMLPGRDASQEKLAILQTLFVQPMLLSNADLGQILRLEALNGTDSTHASFQSQKHLFYIRSWVFTPSQLYTLSMSIQEDGHKFPELDEWKFASFMAGRCNLTVRYVGTSNSRKNALRRFSDDLYSKSQSCLLGALQRCLNEDYPQIFHDAEIHLISDLSFEIFGNGYQIGNQLNADDAESILIHLFGWHSLVNVQLGGHHIRYLPNGGDEIIFKNLRTRYFKDFLSICSAFPEDKWLGLASQFSTVFAGLPAIDKCASESFISKSLKDVLESQAKPYQYLGTTVMAFLGEEPSGGHFRARCSFLDGSSKTSRLIRNFVYRIKNIEESNNFDDAGSIHDLFRAFTFLNTMPLPKYSDKINSLKLLRAYFQCTRPIIVITFGRRAASAIISNLTAINAQSRHIKSFLTLGTYQLAIHSYGPNENDVFIHIPLNHPAKHQYGARSPVELRFFYISMHFAFFVASCTIEVIKTYPKSSHTPPRKALCMEILSLVEKQLQSGVGSIFRSNMELASKAVIADRKPGVHFPTNVFDYLEKLSRERLEGQTTQAESYFDLNLQKSGMTPVAYPPSSYIRLITADFEKNNSIAILDEKNLRRISSFGVAVGEARSEERRQDLHRVWVQAKRELHWSIPHSEDKRDIWMEQFMSLQPGQSYFLRALSQLEDCNYLSALIGDCQPPFRYSTLFTEASGEDISREAVIKCGFWIQKNLIRNHTSLFAFPFITAKEMQGYPIGIKDDGGFMIRWKHPGGSNKSLPLTARFAAPQSSRDSRALSFTEHGIDIVDASGKPLRSSRGWDGGASKASIPKATFLARPTGKLLVDLWTAVRQECGHRVEEEEVIKGSRGWGSKGQKILSRTSTKEQISQQNHPPLENDANFLLATFLDERFPDGGIFRTAPKEKIPDSTEDLQAFVEFCQRPDYINHPYASEWLGLLERDVPLVAHLGRNIQIYRDCNKMRYNGWQPHLKKMVGEVRFHIESKKRKPA